MDKLCLIVSGGAFAPLPEDLPAPDYVIACDRGWQYAERLGVAPDLIVGDFDSAAAPDTSVPVERLPTRKDDTDTMYAARRAVALGWRSIAVCCAFGGRLDHALANIQTAAWIAARGGEALLLGAEERALVFAGGTRRFPRREGWSLSLFAVDGACEGVSLRGTKFDCAGVTLSPAFPLGVSNVWTAACAEVSAERGTLMVLQSKLRKGEHI